MKIKKIIGINICLFTLVFTLYSQNHVNQNKGEINRLIGLKWENSDLDFIEFDSNYISILIKETYPITCDFKYLIKSDTIIIFNNTNKYCFEEFKDTISFLRINSLDRDSLKLELLNDGAKELFKGFESFTFYNSKNIDRFSYYVEKNRSYSKQVNEALKQIENEIFVYCMHWKRGLRLRQEKEFVELLNQHEIKFKDLGPYPDVIPFERNCFCETMNYFVQKKFGNTFIDSLLKKADTLMVLNNRSKFISYSDCDERPYPYIYGSKSGHYNMVAKVDLPVKYNRKEWKTTSGRETFAVYRPFMDIGFYVDTTGELSNFYLTFFNPELDWNKKYEAELFKLGVAKIKEYSTWIPGKILGIKVRTKNNVRVFFENKDEGL